MSLWIGTLASSGGLVGDFESIATVTVGAGGASSIEFTSIPATYQHLQIRMLARDTASGSTGIDYVQLFLNGDESGSATKGHLLYGTGSVVSSGSQTEIMASILVAGGDTANTFGAGVIDLLDYSSTSKNSTIRAFFGTDMNNTNGRVGLASGLWDSTSAVTSVKLSHYNTFAQHTTAALYGVKAP